MDTLFLRIIRQWIPIAVAVSALTCIVYIVIQQNIRIDANDPQIQMAEDLASTLNSGQKTSISGRIDIAKSLAPFTIIYDKQGKILNANAVLDGKMPTVPEGVLNGSVKEEAGMTQKDENRVTWQPEEGVRLATVVVSYDKGYVLVGRNMREIELRESQQLVNILFGWVITLIATFSCVYCMQTFMKGKK